MSRIGMEFRDPINVGCPRCGAAVGEACTDAESPSPRLAVHFERIAAVCEKPADYSLERAINNHWSTKMTNNWGNN